MSPIPRIYISAAHKSSGKTTLSIGLGAALSATGLNVQPFKKGPDYIDPLWLGSACQNNCYNLDFNTMSEAEILAMVQSRFSDNHDLLLTEGNKGLYDGLDLEGSNSNAAMAKLLQSPVILVIDAQGTTRGVAPLLLGYQQFDEDVDVAGVIFNKISGSRHENKLRQVTEHYTDIPVLGAVQRHSDLVLVERHLGLMPYNESGRASQKIQAIVRQVADQVDLKQLIAVARQAPSLATATTTMPVSATAHAQPPVRIGICRDQAFGFYYEDDLEALQAQGAELINIDCLNDKELPAIDGLFIGGGFPETRLQELEANTALRESIKTAIEDGLPTYAECGGLMYLSNAICWQGQRAEMVGIVPADAVMHKKPQGRGYIRLEEMSGMPWPEKQPGREITGHEFHYSRLENFTENLTDKGHFAYLMQRGYGIDGKHDGWVYRNLLASYAHLRNTGKYQWASRFIDFVRSRRQK